MASPRPQTPACTGLLLAGGKSRRMGRDKALVELAGQPLYRRQLHLLVAAGAHPIFLARGAQEPLDLSPGVELLQDAAPESGPLGGLVAGLRRCTTPWLMVVAIDLAKMTPAFLHSLLTRASQSGRGVIVEWEMRLQPLAAVYPRACLPSAEAALGRGELSLQPLCRQWIAQGFIEETLLSEEEVPLFANLNAPEDLRA